MDQDGFTPEVLDALRRVGGVLDVMTSSWPHIPPMLIASRSLNHENLWRTTVAVWDAERPPIARIVTYDDRRTSLERRLRPAQQLITALEEDGVRCDCAYPVPGYQRLFVELAHQTNGFDARWARHARTSAARTQRGDWPIEIQERPWYDAALQLSNPPPGHWTGPAPAGPRAPSWVPAAMQLIYDRAAPCIPPPQVPMVTWSPRDGDGIIHVDWGDGPVADVLASAIGGVSEDRWRSLEVEGHQATYALKRGLSYGMQLAALDTFPHLRDDPSWFTTVELTIPENALNPTLVSAWKHQLERHRPAFGPSLPAYLDYIQAHRDQVHQQAGIT